MAYIEAHQSLRDHRKILALAAELDMPEPHVAGHCLFLWLWAIDNAPEGELPDSVAIIERAAGWRGARGEFVRCMCNARLLYVRDDDGRTCIHDWHANAGSLIEKRRANAERMRKARADKRANADESSDDDARKRATHVQRTSSARAASRAGAGAGAGARSPATSTEISPGVDPKREITVAVDAAVAATAAARSVSEEESDGQIAERVAAGMKWTPGSYDPDDLLAVLRCYPDADADELVKEARKCRQAAPKYHKRADLVWLDNWLRKAFPRQQAAVAVAAEPESDPLPASTEPATEPPPPLPAVSLAGYREDSRTWRAVAAELRSRMSPARFDSVFADARLWLPPKNAPPDAHAIPVLVLHSRATLEQSDRETRRLGQAFQAAAPHIASLRRVCAAQVIAEADAADTEAACTSPADGLPPAEPAPITVIPMAAHRSARVPSPPKGA